MRFYITHQKRFDKLVAEQLLPALPTSEASSSKFPISSSNKNEDNRIRDLSQKANQGTAQARESPSLSGKKRGPVRSPDAEIPPPPSRSPSPPTRIEKGTRGNRFTDEDKQFVVRYLQWTLQNASEPLTKMRFCEMLYQKVKMSYFSYPLLCSTQSWSLYRHPITPRCRG